jgi:hypothetical protein
MDWMRVVVPAVIGVGAAGLMWWMTAPEGQPANASVSGALGQTYTRGAGYMLPSVYTALTAAGIQRAAFNPPRPQF